MKRSEDGQNWTHYGQVFKKTPPWARDLIPNASTSIWAPDISLFRGKYYLFYSVSSFGRNNSVIGLAVNRTLDKNDPHYEWEDLGLIIESGPGDPYNCIDPNLIVDEQGKPWLAFGSFWSGIKLTPLDRSRTRIKKEDEILPIAYRPGSNAVEAPFLIFHEGFYYLFVSFDSCCQGVSSSYKIAVGRSRKVTGIYTDKEGISLLDGGGTILKSGGIRWKGPGHCGVMFQENQWILYYHAYDAEYNGFATLRIEPLLWDDEGWPFTEEPN